MILFVLPAATIYDRQSRVMGWKATPPSRQSMRELRDIVPRLRELGAKRVLFSDLDSDSGKLLARRLNVPYDEWPSLRRLNVGKQHGTPTCKFQELYKIMQSQWEKNPDIPIKGGDSRTSFTKRIATTHERLKNLRDCVVVVAPPEIIKELTKANIELERNRVYAWDSH